MKQETYRKIVSGTASGFAAALMRSILSALSALYRMIVRIRNWLYDKQWLQAHSVGIPVISVGNLTAGGTGKTPLVIWLVRYLEQQGITAAILTRGYKTRKGSLSDEPALLAKACENASVVVNPNRVAGAQKAIQQHQAQVLIMDDGFQHRRLKRDLDILTIDATCPFGYGKILPAGFLREPIESVKRADLIVITRSDQAPAQKLDKIESHIHRIYPDLPIIRSEHRFCCAKAVGSKTIESETLKQKKIFAFCGIGNPNAFLNAMQKQEFTVIGSRIFDDHHSYRQEDLDSLYEQAQSLGAESLVTTEKDWVKAALLAPTDTGIDLVYLAMELDFLDSPDTMKTEIDKILQAAESNRNQIP